MARVSSVSKTKISSKDFIPVKEAAKQVGVTTPTLKRWLKDKEKTKNITWGKDKRGWIYVKEDDIPKLKDFNTSIEIENEGDE